MSPTSPTFPTSPTSPKPTPASPATPTSPKPKPPPAKPKMPTGPRPSVVPPFGSTASLPIFNEPQTAQSARTYLQSEGLTATKVKVKTKIRSERPPEKQSIFARWAKKRDDPEPGAEAEENPKEKVPEPKGDRHSFFTTLGKKTKTYMHQLLQTSEDEKQGLAPLKWDNFLKVRFSPFSILGYSCSCR